MLNFVATIWDCDKKCHSGKNKLEEIDKIVHEFVWNNKPGRIKNKVLNNSKDNGGCA